MAPRPRLASRGYTLTELTVAVALSIAAAAIITEVLIVTTRTSQQASAQADTQGRARMALMAWEQQLRDGWAVLTHYTLQGSPYTTYTTQVTANEQTIVAALPAVDSNGVPCAWRGTNVVYDCVIWQALRDADGLWNVSRLTLTNAFQMPDKYFSRARPRHPEVCINLDAVPPERFFSLLWGAPYTVPTMGRTQESTPVPIISGASLFAVELHDDNHLLAPDHSLSPPVLSPPAVNPPGDLPVWTDAAGQRTATCVTVTNVSVVRVALQFVEGAPALRPGHGEVAQSDTQWATIRLRNKQTW
ncbi:MAG: hypothetical protein GX774_09615 [Armatimonadetes bacterium]|nr:hypothetical protein [Armatimonadota bacterium]